MTENETRKAMHIFSFAYITERKQGQGITLDTTKNCDHVQDERESSAKIV